MMFKKFKTLAEKAHKYPIACLNVAQFTGALNDNIFKLVVVFLLISILGQSKANHILSVVGAIFVIPFLLFSSMGGIFADRFSKHTLLKGMKLFEMVIMFFAIFAFLFKSITGSYILLFLLAAQSALFGPSKYGIIPELVPQNQVAKANGVITGFTYLAIIAGTFMASFITDVSDRNFVLTAFMCLLIAAIGFASTYGIPKTPPQNRDTRINFMFLREIYNTLVYCYPIKHLMIAIISSSYFLFIGAYTQLNIIPLAMESLHLSDVEGGYLFLSTAFGIAFGSYLSGKFLKNKVSLGLTCFSGFMIAILLWFLKFFAADLVYCIAILMLIGVFGGLFIVPSDSFIQINSPDEKRGQIIAAANFLSFIGVLCASFAIYLFGEGLKCSAATGFFLIGIITFIYSLILFFRLSDLIFNTLAEKVLFSIYDLEVHGKEEIKNKPLFVLDNPSILTCMVLIGIYPNIHFVIPSNAKVKYAWLWKCFFSSHVLSFEKGVRPLQKLGKQLRYEDPILCLCLVNTNRYQGIRYQSLFLDYFKKEFPEPLFIKHFKKDTKIEISFERIHK